MVTSRRGETRKRFALMRWGSIWENRHGPSANTRMMDVDDAHVIKAALPAPEAFGELFERHFDRVHRICARRVGRTRAEDLAGETFRRAFESRSSYDLERANAFPWLLGIAVNVARTCQRQLPIAKCSRLARGRGRSIPGSSPTSLNSANSWTAGERGSASVSTQNG